jgi:hypothetical protein
MLQLPAVILPPHPKARLHWRISVPSHSPAPFLGVSRLSWLLPLWASAVTGVVVEGEESEVLMDAEGVCRRARAVEERGRAAGKCQYGSKDEIALDLPMAREGRRAEVDALSEPDWDQRLPDARNSRDPTYRPGGLGGCLPF